MTPTAVQHSRHRRLMDALLAFADASEGRTVHTSFAVSSVERGTGYGTSASKRLLGDLAHEGYLVSSLAGVRWLVTLTETGVTMAHIQRSVRASASRDGAAA